MSQQISEKNFEYFQKSIYTAICARYVELWEGATEEAFVRKMFRSMMLANARGDVFVNDCILENRMHRKELVVIACGYLVEATKARKLRLDDLAWTYLMDAQSYVGRATYACQLRREMPAMEAKSAQDALKSSKSKGGQKTNEVGRVIDDKAVELIKAKAAQGQSWPKVRDAVRAIKPELWPFMEKKDPGRSEGNYERSVVERLRNRSNEIAPFLNDLTPRNRKT